MREQVLQAKIMAILNHRDSPCRVWRNNVGMLRDARGVPVRYGLGVGSPDLVGLVLTTGQFLAIEIKTPVGRLSPEQKAWLATITKGGGLACVMRSEKEAHELVARIRRHRHVCLLHDDCWDRPDLGESCALRRCTKAA